MAASYIDTTVADITSLPQWQEGDATRRRELVRSFATQTAASGVPEAERAPLIDALYEKADTRGAWGFVKQATGEVLKSIPAGAGALTIGAVDALTPSEGSGARIAQGGRDLADSAEMRFKSLAPGDLQETRDAAFADFKSDLDRGAYPPALIDYLTAEPFASEEKFRAMAPGKQWLDDWRDILMRTTVMADEGPDAASDPAKLQTDRDARRGLYDDYAARELVADYIATRDPKTWDALATIGRETRVSWQNRLAKEDESAKLKNFNPDNLLDDITLRALDFQRSPIDMALSAFPLFKGVAALKAAHAAQTGRAATEVAKGVAGEFASGAASEALSQGGTATTGEILESGAMEATGAGVMTAGGAAIGTTTRLLTPKPTAPPVTPPSPAARSGWADTDPLPPGDPTVPADNRAPAGDLAGPPAASPTPETPPPADGSAPGGTAPLLGRLANLAGHTPPPAVEGAATEAPAAELDNSLVPQAPPEVATAPDPVTDPAPTLSPEEPLLPAATSDTESTPVEEVNNSTQPPATLSGVDPGETTTAPATAPAPESRGIPEAAAPATESVRAAQPDLTAPRPARKSSNAATAQLSAAPTAPGAAAKAGQPGAGSSRVAPAAPAPERLPTPAEIIKAQRAEAKARKAEKGPGKSYFRPAKPIPGHENDALEWAMKNRLGRLPKQAVSRLDKTKASRDGVWDRLSDMAKAMPPYYQMVTMPGGLTPDQRVPDAIADGIIQQGATGEDLVNAIWNAIVSRQKHRTESRKRARAEQETISEELRTSKRQTAAFDKATKSGPIKASGADLIEIGDEIDVEGTPLTVIARTKEAVLLQDGDKFGEQWVDFEDIIFIDEYRPNLSPSPPNPEEDSIDYLLRDDTPDFFAGTDQDVFNLTPESAKDRQKREARELAATQAAEKRAADAARKAADARQAKMFPDIEAAAAAAAAPQPALAPAAAVRYSVTRGAHPEHPDLPGLAATVTRAGTPAYQNRQLPGPPAAAAVPAQRPGRGLTPEQLRAEEAARFRKLATGQGADFGPEGTITSVLTSLVNGEIPAFDIRGQKIENPADFALLLQPLRTPLFESVKVAILGPDKVVLHSEVIHVGSVNETILNPSRVVQVMETARRLTGAKGKLSVIYSHNHPSGDTDPSGADRRQHPKVIKAVESAGGTVTDHVITNGTDFFSFASDSIQPLPQPTLAPWEVVSTKDRPRIISDKDLSKYIHTLRSGGATRGHLIYLDTRQQIIAVEIAPETDSKAFIQRATRGASRYGSTRVIADVGHVPHAAGNLLVRDLSIAMEGTQVSLLDVASASVDSYRAAGLMFDPGESYQPTLDGYVREGDPPPPTAPAVPDGWDINRFGLRVQVDPRIRDSWRATFTPAIYKTFGEVELGRRVAAWIGEAGGVGPAAALFLDDASTLIDYERNALGQQLAISLDTRARRMEAAGNAEELKAAEALLDQVIGRLEQLGTQAGQALRAFGMWAKFSPRGIVRAVERKTAEARTTDARTDLGTDPATVEAAVTTAATEAEAADSADIERRTRTAADRWIDRLATSQSDTLSWATPRTLSALEQLIRAHMKAKNPTFATEAEALGVPAHQAAVLDRLILEEHRRRTGIAREKAIEKLVADLTRTAPPRSGPKIPAFVASLYKAAAAGILTRAEFLDAYASHFDKPRFTSDFAATVRQQVERVQATPEGSWLRQKEQSTLLGMLSRFEGIKSADIWTSFWYANILSGLGTQLVNLTGNATHLFLRTVQVGLTNHPRHTFQFIRGMLKGAAEGRRQAAAAFIRGEPVMRGDEEWQKMDVLEMLWSDNPQTWGRKLAKYGAASWGRYVFRTLTAGDALFYNTAKEGRAWLDLSRASARGADIRAAAGFDAPTWAAAQDQAATDLRAAGRPTRTADIDRRAFEIVEAQRDAAITHDARKWGGHATYNYEPEGFMGAIVGGINAVHSYLGKKEGTPARLAAGAIRAAVPFVRIVANITDVNLDWTPIGLLRAAHGRHLVSTKAETFTAAERKERAISGALGTLALAALYTMAAANADDDDDTVPFMIYGMGPKDAGRRSQMPRGWKPFSVKIGGNYYSFEGTPLAYAFGITGTAMDQLRSNKRGATDTDSRALALLTAGPQTVMNSGVLSSLNQTFEMLSGDRKPGTWSERMAASMIPAASMWKDIATALDPIQTDPARFGATFLSYLPILRGQQQPLLNTFGDPVKSPGPWLVQRLVREVGRDDPDAIWLTRKQLQIPSLDNQVAVGMWLDKSEKPQSAGGLRPDRYFRAQIASRISNGYLTPEERTQFLRTTGPQIRKAVQVFRAREANGARITQADINTTVARIRRLGMRDLIK